MTITSVRDGTHDIATPEAFALAEIVPGNVERSGGDIMFLRTDDPLAFCLAEPCPILRSR
jgi:hypothetical protein